MERKDGEIRMEKEDEGRKDEEKGIECDIDLSGVISSVETEIFFVLSSPGFRTKTRYFVTLGLCWFKKKIEKKAQKDFEREKEREREREREKKEEKEGEKKKSKKGLSNR